MSPSDVEKLRSLHRQCRSCLLPTDREWIRKAGARCPVFVEGLVLAIDCDNCRAFDHGKKPDIVALQRCGNRLAWIVIEVKENVDTASRHQIESGLTKIKADRLLQANAEVAEAYVAYRTSAGHSEIQKSLERTRLSFAGKRVRIRARRCPVKINCPNRTPPPPRRPHS